LISTSKFDKFDLIEDGVTETRKHMINLDFYIPPDERFSPTKLAEVLTLAVQAVTHFVLPESKALFHGNINSFRSFEQLKGDLYRKPQQPVVDGQVMDKLKTSVPSHKTYKQVSKMVKETPVKFPIPQVIERKSLSCHYTCCVLCSASL
jgi:lipoxygenase